MTFKNFVLSLFNRPDSTFEEDFKKKIKTIDDVKTYRFWNSLLSFLAERPTESMTTLIEEDFKQESFFDFVQKNTDLSPEIDTLTSYWNESIQDLVDYFYLHLNDDMFEITNNTLERTQILNPKIPASNGNGFSSIDIKNADAGNVFAKVTSEIWAEIVRPWYNIDWLTYYSVRNDGDTIDQKAASNDKNLSFTRLQEPNEFEDQLNRWIRLIMPNNSRRVSVEDLNRNFWVISSVLSAVSTYLFDPAAPIPYLTKGILKELLQLWDNVLYLWAAFAIISQKEAADLRTIILPLPKSALQPYVKYDDFIVNYPTTLNEEKAFVLERVKYLIKKYSHSNLCILPYTRNDNYYKNHFSSQSFRCVIFYNAQTEKISFIPLRARVDGVSTYTVYFNPHNFDDYLYAIRETDTYYKWSFPIKNIGNVLDGDDYSAKRFYSALRIRPTIDFCVNEDGKLQLSTLSLVGVDAVEESLYGNTKMIISYTSSEPIKEDDNVAILDREIGVSGEAALGNLDIYDGVVKQAYYLGEIPSYCNFSASQPLFVYSASHEIIGEGKLIKIGNYLPKTFYSGGYYEDASYYAEQRVPDNSRTTDYLLNLTITGSNHKGVVSDIYGGLGSSNQVSSSECYYFTPVINGKNSYRLACDRKVSSSMNATSYAEQGWNVIRDYIVRDTTPTKITYYIGAVGIKPWHNTTNHTLFQGYWASTILTHLYRYIPSELEDYLPDEEIAAGEPVLNDSGSKIGTLQTLGIVNKEEKAFTVNGNDAFAISGGTTWRLPQLIPEKTVAGYLTYIETTSGITYFVDPSKNSTLNTAYQTNGIAGVTNELNTNYADYIGTDVLMTKDNIKVELTDPRGTWTVFDGNSNVNYNNNVDIYKKQTDRREVAYLDFYFSPISGTSTRSMNFSSVSMGRSIRQGSFSPCNPYITLPAASSSTMEFSW